MLIDFTTTIDDLDDKPIPFEEDKELTLAIVAETALLANTEETNKLPGVQKVHRAALAQEIHKKEKVDVMAEDIAMLKEVIAKTYAPIVIMRAWDILDPKVKGVEKAATH